MEGISLRELGIINQNILKWRGKNENHFENRRRINNTSKRLKYGGILITYSIIWKTINIHVSLGIRQNLNNYKLWQLDYYYNYLVHWSFQKWQKMRIVIEVVASLINVKQLSHSHLITAVLYVYRICELVDKKWQFSHRTSARISANSFMGGGGGIPMWVWKRYGFGGIWQASI